MVASGARAAAFDKGTAWAAGAEVLIPAADGRWQRGVVVAGGRAHELRVRLLGSAGGSGETVSAEAAAAVAANPSDLELAEDLASLPHLGGRQLLRTLALRYHRGAIYTMCGPSLLALNPWRQLPLYGEDVLQRCRAGARSASPPAHIFAVAATALELAEHEGSDQVVVVSGESGVMTRPARAPPRTTQPDAARTVLPVTFQHTPAARGWDVLRPAPASLPPPVICADRCLCPHTSARTLSARRTRRHAARPHDRERGREHAGRVSTRMYGI